MKNNNNNNKEKRHCGCYKEPCASEGTGILIAIAIKYPEWLNRKTNHVLPKIRLFVRNSMIKIILFKSPHFLVSQRLFLLHHRKIHFEWVVVNFSPNVLNYSIIMIGLRFHVADYSWSNFLSFFGGFLIICDSPEDFEAQGDRTCNTLTQHVKPREAREARGAEKLKTLPNRKNKIKNNCAIFFLPAGSACKTMFTVVPDSFCASTTRYRLDFRRLPGPVFDPPRKERDECGMSVSGDECGLIFPNSGW